jgi:hypothetical protein
MNHDFPNRFCNIKLRALFTCDFKKSSRVRSSDLYQILHLYFYYRNFFLFPSLVYEQHIPSFSLVKIEGEINGDD